MPQLQFSHRFSQEFFPPPPTVAVNYLSLCFITTHTHTFNLLRRKRGAHCINIRKPRTTTTRDYEQRGESEREREFYELRSFAVISWKKRTLKNVFICRWWRNFLTEMGWRHGIDWKLVWRPENRLALQKSSLFFFRDVHHR